MPTNKNAIIRYMILDQMLSDRHHYYTRTDLYKKCNEKLYEAGYPEVTKRTIEKDLIDIQDNPFKMEIEELAYRGKRIIRYRDQMKSLFSKQMSNDEKILIREILNTLGQFKGLDNFSWIEDLKEKLNSSESFGETKYNINKLQDRKIIQFSTNEFLKNKESLGWFFSAISNRLSVFIKYRKFGDKEPMDIVVCPYLLKEYNQRWYLICNYADNTDSRFNPQFLMNLPLDRIESYEIAHNFTYIDSDIDFDEYFEDIIGITRMPDREIEKVLFCIDEKNSFYIETKPIHGSQTRLCQDSQELLRKKYPKFKNRIFYTINCIIDEYELPRALMGFGNSLVVLEPHTLRIKIYDSLKAQIDNYSF